MKPVKALVAYTYNHSVTVSDSFLKFYNRRLTVPPT